MYLGNAATEFQVTRLTEASFIVSTPTRARMPAMLTLWESPSQEALADHNDNKPQQVRQAGGYSSLDQDGFRRVADGLSLG
jgi:hypothetical protein